MKPVTRERVADRGWAVGRIHREIRQYSSEGQVVISRPVPVRLSKRQRSSLILRCYSWRIVTRYAHSVGDEDLLEVSFSRGRPMSRKPCSSYLEERNERPMPGREEDLLAYVSARMDTLRLHVRGLTP